MKVRFFGSMRACFLTLSELISALIASTSHVRTSMFTFQFEGKLTRVDDELSSEFSEGDTFKGTYTFDTTVSPFDLEFLLRGENRSFIWKDVISAVSFISRAYTASSTNGSIFYEHDNANNYSADFDQVSGRPVRGYLPSSMGVRWDSLQPPVSGDLFLSKQLDYNPNLQAHLRDIELADAGAYADADGNVITDFEAYYRDDPNRPVFFSCNVGRVGEPIGLNGKFVFGFINEDQSRAGIGGELTSVTLIQKPAAGWLFSTDLLGLSGFTRHKQIS